MCFYKLEFQTCGNMKHILKCESVSNMRITLSLQFYTEAYSQSLRINIETPTQPSLHFLKLEYSYMFYLSEKLGQEW